MEGDVKTVRRVGAETGLGWKFVSKDFFITDLLKQLEPLLPDGCVMKGGTAISRGGFSRTPRFSEDLDFDVYLRGNFKKMVEEYKALLAGLSGFEIRRPRMMSVCVRFDAFFYNHFGERDRIMLEFSPIRRKPPNEPIASKIIVQSPYTGGRAALIRAYSKQRLMSMKIDALSTRKNGKDIYDICELRDGLNSEHSITDLREYLEADKRDCKNTLSLALENLSLISKEKKLLINSTNHYLIRNSRLKWDYLIQSVEDYLSEMKIGCEKTK